MKQLVVAHKFGDKTVIAKCWLFIAMSRMQQQYFRDAKTIVRNVFKQTQTKGMKHLTATSKLVTICRGIWARLKHEINLHQQNKNETGMPGIEVECKFVLPKDCRRRLEDAGAIQEAEKVFRDVYLDMVGLKLIRKDTWLRFREGKMELKYPQPNLQHTSKNTIYREETDLQAICKILGCTVPTSCDDLPDGWIPLLDITTKREVWRLDDIVVVLDELEDGFTLGEVEVVVDHPDKVGWANTLIDQLADRLGFRKQREGKVDHALREQNPEALHILQQPHIAAT